MSVTYNEISATLEDDVYEGIITDVKGIEAKMPWAVTLPVEEKLSMRGLGLRSIDFIDKSFEYALKNPDLPPHYLNIAEFGRDVKLMRQLQVLMQHLVPLTGKLKDTYTIVAHEAYDAARSFYLHLKNASSSNIPGASPMVRELGKRFRVARASTPANPEEPAAVKTLAPGSKTGKENENSAV